MKVSELIEKLQKENPDELVFFENQFHGIGAEVTKVKRDEENHVVIC